MPQICAPKSILEHPSLGTIVLQYMNTLWTPYLLCSIMLEIDRK